VPDVAPRYYGPVVAGDLVYIVSGAGVVQAFDPDTGVAVESFATGKTVSTAPQIAGGRMFIISTDGTLTAIE
jgi:outer membrane protein assembly factor BamB